MDTYEEFETGMKDYIKVLKKYYKDEDLKISNNIKYLYEFSLENNIGDTIIEIMCENSPISSYDFGFFILKISDF